LSCYEAEKKGYKQGRHSDRTTVGPCPALSSVSSPAASVHSYLLLAQQRARSSSLLLSVGQNMKNNVNTTGTVEIENILCREN